VLAVGAAACGVWAAHALAPVNAGDLRPVRVEIAPGTHSRAIADQLAAAGVIRSALAFDALAHWDGVAGRLQAGEYDFSPSMSALQVLARIVHGDVVTYRVTVPAGADVEQVAAAVAASGLWSRDQMLAAAKDPSLVAPWLPAGAPVRYAVEGYLYPDTYTFTRADSPRAVLATMVGRFARAAAPLAPEAASRHLTLNQWVTLASMVEREASTPADQSAVAAVFLNRLRIGMALQSDPTVLYALGERTGELTAADLAIASPYNTYRSTGLPPGPIASPDLGALQAVLHPAAITALYFIARPDGTLVFAQTYAQQLANEREYLQGAR
jgi:UPF0755 protein